MTKKYCYLCGQELETNDDILYKCKNCGQSIYENPKPCVDIIIFNDDGQVLIAKRLREPYKGKYDLPGGFVDYKDNLETAIEREVKEELGIEKAQLKNIRYIGSYNSEYPWINEVLRVSSAVFMAEISNEIQVKAMDDVELVLWVSPEDLNNYHYSIPQTIEMINLAIKLRS
jgi:NAD+ diphosphatase